MSNVLNVQVEIEASLELTRAPVPSTTTTDEGDPS